jgi:acetyl-CoA carboxylase carboxyltransferase component
MLGIPSADPKVPFDPRHVIARLVDDSDFDEFKPLYGTSLVTGFAEIHGYPVGVLANHRGVLFSEEAEKAAQFIQLCNQIDVPLLFLHNITGYIVGTDFEQGGITKNGSKMINAVSNSTVPHLTVIVGASYGAGNYGMSGRAFGTRFTFIWPTAKIAVMGPKQMAGVMTIVQRAATERRGEVFDERANDRRVAAVEHWAEERSKGLFATSRVSDDAMIDPRDTRDVLGIALSACHNKAVVGTKEYGTWRM